MIRLGGDISIAAQQWFGAAFLIISITHQFIAQFVYFSGGFKVDALVSNLIATVRLVTKILLIAHKYLPRFAHQLLSGDKVTMLLFVPFFFVKNK